MASVEFQNLLAVQDRDTVIDQLRHRRAALPERAARQALLERGQAIAADRDGVVATRDEIAERETAIERDLGTSEERIATIDKRLYSGEVSATRDLQAMAHEIDRLKEYCSGLEDRALELLDEREPLDARIAELDGQLQGLATEVRAAEASIAEQEAVIDAELAVEEGARSGLAADIPSTLLDRYEVLRKRLGSGAAPLNGHSCGGCHLELPATEIDRIRREPPDALILCDQCGRILVRPS